AVAEKERQSSQGKEQVGHLGGGSGAVANVQGVEREHQQGKAGSLLAVKDASGMPTRQQRGTPQDKAEHASGGLYADGEQFGNARDQPEMQGQPGAEKQVRGRMLQPVFGLGEAVNGVAAVVGPNQVET